MRSEALVYTISARLMDAGEEAGRKGHAAGHAASLTAMHSGPRGQRDAWLHSSSWGHGEPAQGPLQSPARASIYRWSGGSEDLVGSCHLAAQRHSRHGPLEGQTGARRQPRQSLQSSAPGGGCPPAGHVGSKSAEAVAFWHVLHALPPARRNAVHDTGSWGTSPALFHLSPWFS